MLRHPIYLALASAACAYLAFANARGWSPFYLVTPASIHHGSGSSLHHK